MLNFIPFLLYTFDKYLLVVLSLNKIKELRQQKSMTQSQLGSYLNVGNTAVSMYETEQRQLDPATISSLCTLFECTADYLLCRSEVKEASLSEEDAAILKAYHAAREKDRMLVDTILSEYKENDKAQKGQ